LQRSAGNQATQRILQSGGLAQSRSGYRAASGVPVVERDPPTTEELDNPEARRQFRRQTGGRFFGALRWLGRVIPGPVGRWIRNMSGVGEGARPSSGATHGATGTLMRCGARPA